MEPIIAIIIGFSVLFVLSAIAWPRKGLVAIWKRFIWNAKRVQIEDALKLFYQQEEDQIISSVKKTEEALTLSPSKVNKLINNLENRGLVKSIDDKIELTSEGRIYSLQVIRNHRLWEKFLADETGVKEVDWHTEAEHAEHNLTPEQADELAAKIGNPLIDPHGDPIPTSDGKMPERKGKPVTELKYHEYGEIVHLEDEPIEVYEQLIKKGLYPGMYLQLKSISERYILFEANGKNYKIKSEFGKNISVAAISPHAEIIKEFRSLSTLKVGESGSVLRISNAVRGKQRRRLLDFGIVPGTTITPRLVSFSGDPVAYNIRGASIALRKAQAEMIFIEESGKEK